MTKDDEFQNNPNSMKIWAALCGIDLESAYTTNPRKITETEQNKLLGEMISMDDDTMLKISKELGSVDRSSLSRRYDKTTGIMVIGHVPDYVIYDEAQSIYSYDYEYEPEEKGASIDGPKGNYWTQPIPPKDKGMSAGPSEAKRKQLRAKRKKHKR